MRSLNLILAAVWLAVLIYFLAKPATNWLVVAIAGLMLLWNLVRWFTFKPATRTLPPLDPGMRPAQREYNPDFDFHKPDRPPSGG